MHDPIDWSLTTFEGLRRHQHQEFMALSFREKIAVIEQLEQIAASFTARREARQQQHKTRGEGAADQGPH
jgi:hypothetical protein